MVGVESSVWGAEEAGDAEGVEASMGKEAGTAFSFVVSPGIWFWMASRSDRAWLATIDSRLLKRLVLESESSVIRVLIPLTIVKTMIGKITRIKKRAMAPSRRRPSMFGSPFLCPVLKVY